jgi:hypothetical protein
MSARDLLDPAVREAVEAGIGVYANSPLERAVAAAGVGELAIKYSGARYADTIRTTRRLHISSALDYTWGTGVYCAPLDNPISSAIYGRVGSVARFAPDYWRIFDATDLSNQVTYIHWLQSQPLYGLLTLTVHAQLANQLMRDHFRSSFEIDCVVFHPDQADTTRTAGSFGAVYTRPNDIWMCVSDFGPNGALLRGPSPSFRDAWPCVLIEEEFEPLLEAMVFAPQIGPLGGTPAGSTLAASIAAAYAARDWVRVEA